MIRTSRHGLRAAAAASLTAAVALPLASCGDGNPGGGKGEKTQLTVLAASSLTDVFEKAGAVYEKEHPGTEVKFSFAGSQELAAQVKQGAPADAVATADMRTAERIGEETRKPTVFARNRLVIVTKKGEGTKNGAGTENGAEKGSSKRVESLKDLADPGLKVVLAAPEVPAGRYARQVLDGQKVRVEPSSEEPNVRSVLNKVGLGEADAGIVYRTDAVAERDKVEAVEIPQKHSALAAYPAAALESSRNPQAAGEFVEWLTSPQAQRILRDAGFLKP